MSNPYIYGDAHRIFINTELGCSSSCSYCYLPSVGLKINAKKSDVKRISIKELLGEIFKDDRIIKGKNGTLLSIGCFSECWDSRNRQDTIELINSLIPLGNPIQLASKRELRAEDLSCINISCNYRKQLGVFVSSATISRWKEYEKGTSPPSARFKTFENCISIGISSFLYIKPTIPGVTNIDASHYGRLMTKYNISAVVGDAFIRAEENGNSPISGLLKIAPDVAVDHLRQELKKYGSVFKTSDEAMATLT
jgi:DNA repair photolyase